MCNGTLSPNAGGIAAIITDEIFGPYSDAPKSSESVAITEGQLKKFSGIFRDVKTRFPLRFTIDKGVLKLGGTELKPVGNEAFMLGNLLLTFTLDKYGKPIAGQLVDPEGSVDRFVIETEWTPTAADLTSFSGEWYGEEAGASLTFALDGDKATLRQRPTLNLPLRALYKDHFAASGYIIWFTRDASGKVDKMHVGSGRMRDMPFVRVK